MSESKSESPVVAAIRDRYEWKKVRAPAPWYPKEIDEELVGYYGGRTVKSGRFGQYEVAMVHVPREGSFTVSGAEVIQLIDASRINPGWPVRIVWRGREEYGLGEDGKKKTKKRFDVYVAPGEPVPESDLPFPVARMKLEGEDMQ